VVYGIGVQSFTAGSNPSKVMDVGLLCCVLSTQRLLRRADRSPREVLQAVCVSNFVCSTHFNAGAA
jgi:hypothetical protein